jgi:phage terminase large subunit
MFNCTPVFWENRNSKAKIVINQGGTSSSKTYSIMQLLMLIAIENPRYVITVTGESVPNLKKGSYRDAETIYTNTPDLQKFIKSWNKTDRTIQFVNGSIMEFITNLDEQSAKNGKRDVLFVNEANGISWLIYWQLAIRTRQKIFMDYNPSVRFWAHDNLHGNSDVELLISDHRHNCFLTDEEHKKIERIPDKELWKVYARGLTGNITGIIFPEWQKIPDDAFPKDAEVFAGVDFGYTNDPTAVVKVCRVGETIFIHEICYTAGISPMQLKQLLFANGFNSDTPVYCEHDPEIISQLRRLQVMALPARKGQGSIKAGIAKLKEFKVRYTESSKNLHEERTRYSWITDNSSGSPTNTPIDQWNHLIDAVRYAIYTHYSRR